jgi:hypothetical protein
LDLCTFQKGREDAGSASSLNLDAVCFTFTQRIKFSLFDPSILSQNTLKVISHNSICWIYHAQSLHIPAPLGYHQDEDKARALSLSLSLARRGFRI